MVYTDTPQTPATQGPTTTLPAPTTGTTGTTDTTGTTGTGGTANQQSQHLLTDITSTVNAIKGGDWLSAGLGLTNVAMDIIGMSGNPLGGLLSAGIGWIIEHVKFLKEPFDKLLGSPQSITSTAQSWTQAGTLLNQVATQLRTSSTSQTTGWTGTAADTYRTASDTHANAVDSLGNASSGMSGAMTQIGQVLANVRKAVLDLITKAVQQIIQIILEALASSWASFGTSIAAGIVKSVQTAVSTAQKAASKISKFVQTAQKVIQLIQKILQAAQAVKQLIQQLTSKNEDTSTSDPQTQALATNGLGISSTSLTNMDAGANANYANVVPNSVATTLPAPAAVSDTGTVNPDTSVPSAATLPNGLTPVSSTPVVNADTTVPNSTASPTQLAQANPTPTVNPNAQPQATPQTTPTRALPRGVPSWGPTGPPPDAGRSYSRTQINQWVTEARQAMAANGTTISDQDAGRIAGLIEHESSNNPHAINLWDRNATAGHPSKGLMQTIDSTFDAYHLDGHNDIWNPVDNIIAGTRYGIHTYGSVGQIPGVRAVERGGHYVGY